MREDARLRAEGHQESRSSTWSGPQPGAAAEAGAPTGSSDRVLASLQTAMGLEGITDPRRERGGGGPPERSEPPPQSDTSATGSPPGPLEGSGNSQERGPCQIGYSPWPRDEEGGVDPPLSQRQREDLEARQAYEASRPSVPSAGAEGLAQDIASMLVVLGELGDTPLPNEQDSQSLEEFMQVLRPTGVAQPPPLGGREYYVWRRSARHHAGRSEWPGGCPERASPPTFFG
eukprot:1495859-Amphidinium_carterae.2